MKHNIRINGKVQEMDCELGSGIKTEKGKEIFENDIIRYSKRWWENDGKVYRVKWIDSCFVLVNDTNQYRHQLSERDDRHFVIIGHAED